MITIEYTIENNPTAAENKVIRDGVVDFNKQRINETATAFSIFAKNGDQIIGGALIVEISDALYIDELWCDEKYRKSGIGTKIVAMIVEAAENKSLPKIFVDTYEFQAQTFYEKQGFYCIGTIPKYVKNYDRIFMRKDIA